MTPIDPPHGSRARALPALLLLLGLCLALAASARAQSPRLGGDVYSDETNFGFRVHVPDGWVFVPPSPDDGNVIAKYAPKTGGEVVVSSKAKTVSLKLESWILKFDRRPPAKAAAGELTRRQTSVKDIATWVKENLGSGFAEESKKLEVGKTPATELVFTQSNGDYEVGVYAMLYELAPELDIAVAYIAPGGAGKWGKYEAEFKKLARTFKPVALKAGKEIVAAGDTLRDRKRVLLQKELANQGDWKLYETENYFIVSNNDDREFIKDLMERIEAIRTVFEKDYPAARVDEIRASAARTGGPEPKPQDKAAAKSPPKAQGPDPRELSRTSVVRVCKNREQYMSYGAPPNTGGFWYSVTEELVVFDDQAVLGRAKTWGTLFHEAFHQYIYYFYGNIAPHSWYNEGTGDFYSGYEYKNKRFTLGKPSERNDTVREALRSGKFVPLVELVRMSQKEYYSDSKHGSDIGTHYAQGWALIYFLRTGKKSNAKGWNPRWDTILDTYLTALASSGKIEQAVEQAFTGIDFDELQAAWIEYTK